MLICMRTTIQMDNQLFQQIKRLAIETHRSMKSIIEDSLRETVAKRRQTVRPNRINLPTYKGQGLQSGVDLDHTSSLYDLMEGKA